MYCFKCGKQIPDNSAFCSYCGTHLKKPAGPSAASTANTETPIYQTAPSIRKEVRISGFEVNKELLVTVAALIFAGVFFYYCYCNARSFYYLTKTMNEGFPFEARVQLFFERDYLIIMPFLYDLIAVISFAVFALRRDNGNLRGHFLLLVYSLVVFFLLMLLRSILQYNYQKYLFDDATFYLPWKGIAIYLLGIAVVAGSLIFAGHRDIFTNRLLNPGDNSFEVKNALWEAYGINANKMRRY